jgi:hypothetical protein
VTVCADCGVAVPRPRRGSPRRRCDACRREYAKTYPSRQPGHYYVCACGRPRANTAAKCLTCYWAERRRQIHICQHCGQSFRPKRSVCTARCQNNKYCSRACYFRAKHARAEVAASAEAEALEARRAERAFARSFALELRKRLPADHSVMGRFCRCGAAITQFATGFCAPCIAEIMAARVRAGHSVARLLGVAHICPNCGRSFRGYPRAVCCSRRCDRQISKWKKGRRYPSIQHVPVDERNKLAELIALTRAANRRLYKHG